MSEIGSDSGSPKPVDFAAPTQQEQDEEPHSEPEQQNADEATSDGGDADPTRDTDEAAPLSEDHDADDAEDGGDASDKDSDLLSEIDEDQFDDFGSGPAPVTIDENVTKTLKAAKRRRVDGAAAKKPKEGKRQKKRARSEEDDVESAGGEPAARRPRKARAAAEARAERREPQQQEQEDENEEDLTPEERRRRALERAMDAAVKGNPNKRRRKKDEVDLEDELDEQIASLKVRMERACVADNDAREAGRPAVHKLKLLPEVTALLNRSSAQDNLLDPETNFLQSIKYFLEPLNDGSLPAYNIQRDIFTALTRLPVEKEALLSSGIGKVVLFYTRSKRPEVGIKRMAERLLGEWSRPVLKRTDDYKKRHVETRDFDYVAAKLAQRQTAIGSQFSLAARPAGDGSQGANGSSQAAPSFRSRLEADRERALAPVVRSNRAQPAGLPASYTVAPRSTFDASRAGQPDHRPIGAGGLEAFRRMTQKNKGRRA